MPEFFEAYIKSLSLEQQIQLFDYLDGTRDVNLEILHFLGEQIAKQDSTYFANPS